MTANQALRRSAPRVTERAFYERRGSYICASLVHSTAGHAQRSAAAEFGRWECEGSRTDYQTSSNREGRRETLG